MKAKKLAIDAINIRSSGGIVHLDGILKKFNRKFFDKILVLINNQAFSLLQEKKKYSKHIFFVKKKIFNQNVFLSNTWKTFLLNNFIKSQACSHLLSLNGYYLGNFKPTIIFSQNALPFINSYRMNFLTKLKIITQRILHIYSIKKFQSVVYVSNFQKKIVEKKLNFIPNNRKVIYHGINKIIKKKKTHKINKILKLLYVSQFIEYKNHLRLFKAVQNINRKKIIVELDCYGQNNINLRSPIKEITIFKLLPNKEINKLYYKYDAFIFPSFAESFGLPLVEASRSGLLICCSDLPVFKELLDKKNIFIFDPKKEKSIENSIKKLIFISKKDKLSRVKINYSRSLRFNWKKSASELFNFIYEIKK